jgi:hypothetical protein
MTAIILIAWAVSLTGCVLSLTGSSLAHIAGAVGWIALGFSFSHAGVLIRERRGLRWAYSGILSVARSGMCIHGERFDCRCPSVETCGACWASVMGLEPEEWLEWYTERELEQEGSAE